MKKINGKLFDDTPGSLRMSYPTYAHLKNTLESQRRLLHERFVDSLSFIPHPSNKDIRKGLSSARDFAYEVFRKEDAEFTIMLNELKTTAAGTYKDHPSIDMRKFWGLKE